MKAIKRTIASLLTLIILFAMTGCNSQSAKTMSFANDMEFSSYLLSSYWMHTENNNGNTIYHIYDFSMGVVGYTLTQSQGESTEDMMSKLIAEYREGNSRTNPSFNSLFMFFPENLEGFEQVQYSISSGEVEADYQTASVTITGTEETFVFLENNTMHHNGQIYEQTDLGDLKEAFKQAIITYFEEYYGGSDETLLTYQEIQAGMQLSNNANYWREYFILTGTAELSDYYNYDYLDYKVLYDCLRIVPEGDSPSNAWYVYGTGAQELFDRLEMTGSANVVLVCEVFFPEAGAHNMVDLVNYCIID